MPSLSQTQENLEARIYIIRRQKVMLDADLAQIYRVPTGRLNEQVKRNRKRFPEDFMFQLTTEEVEDLRSQFAISNKSRGGRRYLPYAFTEHGAVMLASVLNSQTAVEASVQIVRAYIRLRHVLSAHKELARKLETHDKEITAIWKVIKLLTTEPVKKMEPIGFRDRSQDK